MGENNFKENDFNISMEEFSELYAVTKNIQDFWNDIVVKDPVTGDEFDMTNIRKITNQVDDHNLIKAYNSFNSLSRIEKHLFIDTTERVRETSEEFKYDNTIPIPVQMFDHLILENKELNKVVAKLEQTLNLLDESDPIYVFAETILDDMYS